jgi:hypothetical protein
MQKTTTLKNLLILLCCGAILASCKNGGLFGKKKYDKSEATGWNYNDKNMGGFQVAKANDRASDPDSYLYRVVPSPWARWTKT